ncbi:MAG: MBL fold metallo-hydrolase [Pseudomonadota bacterium]
MIKRILFLILLLMVVSAGWLHLTDYMSLAKATIARTVKNTDYANSADPSEVKLLFCGTGSPNRTPFRASPCLALIAYGDLYLFDAGEGAISKLHEFQAPVLRLRKIFLTHLHSDHMSGVAEVLHNTWLYGREKTATLVGPPGTKKLLAGIRTSYEDDLDERLHVLSTDGVRSELAFPEAEDVEVAEDSITLVHKDDKLSIEAFQVVHPHWPHAYGYRIKVAGKTIVVSGDTTISPGVAKYAAGADYLVHEALNSTLMNLVGQELEKISVPISSDRIARIAEVHTDTLELAELAQTAQVKHLVLTHLIPPVPDIFPARQAFTSGMSDRYDGELTVAGDGLELRIN